MVTLNGTAGTATIKAYSTPKPARKLGRLFGEGG
jgi:hypothetical protein